MTPGRRSLVRGVAAGGLLAFALASSGVASADPWADYTLHCAGCHRMDGLGAPPDVPSFPGSLGRFPGVPGGRAFLIRVPGAAQSELDDARLAAVLNWMLHTFSEPELPRGFRPYRADEVARERREPLTDVASVRADLVRAMRAELVREMRAPPRDEEPMP